MHIKAMAIGMLLGVYSLTTVVQGKDVDQRKIKELVAQLDADEPKIYRAAEQELVSLGEAAVPALKAAAAEGAVGLRERARDVLIKIEFTRFQKPLPMGLPVVTSTEADAVETMLRSIGFAPNDDLREYLATRRAPLKWGGPELTWFELQEQICAATKTRWGWAANDLYIVPERKPLPTVRVGALRVSFAKNREYLLHNNLKKMLGMDLTFIVSADPRVLPISTAESTFHIDEMIGPDNQKLVSEPPALPPPIPQRNTPTTFGAAFSHFADRREWEVTMRVSTPPEHITRISKLSGRLALQVATGFKEIEIADLEKPGKVEHETLLGTLTSVKLEHSAKEGHRLHVAWRYPADKKTLALAESELAITRMVITGDDGTRWRPTVDSYKDDRNGTWQFVLALQPLTSAKGGPKKLHWRVAQHWQPLEIPFVLKDLPLERVKLEEKPKAQIEPDMP